MCLTVWTECCIAEYNAIFSGCYTCLIDHAWHVFRSSSMAFTAFHIKTFASHGESLQSS